jgi:uncharacterized protein YndB with AHSA1/START domain
LIVADASTGRRHLQAVPVTEQADDVTISRLEDAVVAEVMVARAAPETFALFIDTLADWWPLRDYSMAPGEVVAVEVDRRPGGSVTEVRRDGSRARWGTLLAWEPGHRFAMDWLVTPGLERTVVTVTFTVVAPARTRVTLVHSGWQGIDPARLGLQFGYTEGWIKILGCFVSSTRTG